MVSCRKIYRQFIIFLVFLQLCLALKHVNSSLFSFGLKRKIKHHQHHKHHRYNDTIYNITVVPSNSSSTTFQSTLNEETEFKLRSTSYAYIMELEIGAPPQKLEFLVDTGSSNMAIAGPSCSDPFGRRCQIDAFYHPEWSLTSKNLNIPINTEYGKGAWSGTLFKDVVAFPAGGPSTIAEFAVIHYEKDFFLKNAINEGILGLAYKSLATDGIEPLYDQIVRDTDTPNIFTLALCNGMGQMWLGLPESEAFVDKIHYTDIEQESWYTVTMTGIDVAGNSLGLSPHSFPQAIVDSGTTDILLQPEIYIAVISVLKQIGPPVDERFWRNYCVDTDPFQWPYITIYLKDTEGGSFGLTVLGKHYVRKQDEFHCLSIGAKQTGAVLGEVVLEGNVAIFDRANQRLGFAPSNISYTTDGRCGNPVAVNTTVQGSLLNFCQEADMPNASCHSNCGSCIRAGGDWCPHGTVAVWINGIRSVLDTHQGFCWPGGLFSFRNNKVQTYLKGHGSAEFQVTCSTPLPMFMQCKVRGIWLVLISSSVICSITMLTFFMCCRTSKFSSGCSLISDSSSEPKHDAKGGAAYPYFAIQSGHSPTRSRSQRGSDIKESAEYSVPKAASACAYFAVHAAKPQR